ncbi:PIN domain-like protein [Phlebopus sp. FC_14]|nr:PIN domain-like protein [Phlebopus sp. FC_14]
MPHQHRHVLGWHRILTELKEGDVRAICVFDGKERGTAKMREIERRRELRKVESARGFIETRRLNRLHKLTRLLSHYCSLSTPDRQRITNVLSKVTEAPSLLPLYLQDLTIPSAVDAISAAQRPRTTPSDSARELPLRDYQTPYLYAHGGLEEEELQEVIASNGLTSSALRQHESRGVRISGVQDRDDGFSHISADPYATAPFVTGNDAVLDPVPSWSQEVLNTPASGGVESELFTLYHEYRQCVAQLTSMPSSYEISLTPGFVADTNETQIECAMSKQQLQMTLDEGRIWRSLSMSSDMTPSLEAETTLSSLAERSTAISRSYQRRSNPPSLETYEESKEIVQAMGVPCIETTGPFEAEALASSLVIHGHADYVASEDTDVLVYEAPLVRNLTSRDSPLVIVSGPDIRTTLRLDRSSYIDFILLLGTDFSQRIKNVGPHRALKFIREHGSIERVITQESKYPPRVSVPDYLEQVEVARLVFRTLPPVPPPELLQPTEENLTAVSEIIQRYKLHRVLYNSWECQASLAGNYFDDNPTAI